MVKKYILVFQSHLEVGYEGPGVPLQVEGGEDELVEGAAALVDQVEELPVIRPRLQVAGEQPERRVLAYHHYYHCFQQVSKRRRLLWLRPLRLTWSISILSWRSSPSPTTSAVLAPSLLTTRILTPGVGAVLVTTLVPVGWNGTLKWLMIESIYILYT